MALFDKRTIVEKYEDQFKVKEMQNKHLFYDLYARVGDPEELRGFIVETLGAMDWNTAVNELTKFEEMDVEGVFRGGKLKPVRSIVKSFKELKKGPKLPWLWKALFLVGCFFLGFYLYTLMFPGQGWESDLIIKITPIWYVAAIIVYMIKEKVNMAIWVKIAGVYDIGSEEADLRIVIAADADKKDKEAYDKLEDDVSEFYNVLTRRYVKKLKRETTKEEVLKEMPKSKEEPDVRMLRALRDIDNQISQLEKSFIEGKMAENTYKQLKEDLGKKKTKIETLMDLLSI